MSRFAVAFLMIIVGAAIAGCAMNRAGVTGLTEDQARYYGALRKALTENRERLAQAFSVQLRSDVVRQRNILEWSRDLERAEIILSQRQGVIAGQRRLLYMKLAEADLADVESLAVLDNIDVSRRDAILALYDKVVAATEALERNNAVILQFLSSRDESFALRSLDIPGIFRVVAAIEEAREDAKNIDAKAREESHKRRGKIEKELERARDLLIRLYSK